MSGSRKWRSGDDLARRVRPGAEIRLRRPPRRRGRDQGFRDRIRSATVPSRRDSARGSFFGGLAASGWHTAALTMRLLVESGFRPAGGIIGSRAEELKWPRPVRPGDELHVEAEVLEVRASNSRPGQGFLKCRTTTLNQNGEPVQILVMNLLVKART
ncbi:MAG: MaoC/PaaZ C-terminal domain-containing protein [Myxococcales bacterium]